MTFVDRSLQIVRDAVKLIGKKPLAARLKISDATLRAVDHDDFSPTARTLRKLEEESRVVLRANGQAVPDDIQ